MRRGQLAADQIAAFERTVAPQEVQRDVSLAPLTSFHIGGAAALFIEIDDAARLAEIVGAARTCDVEVLILGGGTNLLVSDNGFDGLALKLNFDAVNVDSANATVEVGASVKSAVLVDLLIRAGYGGLTFAAGLPGTIGGALAGNAGCFGASISDGLIEARIIDAEGSLHVVEDPDWFAFDYRGSNLLTSNSILTSATFALQPEAPEALRTEANHYLEVRRTKHPHPGTFTAGSYFKNLPPAQPGGRRQAAGALLDQVGAKQLSVGDAAVFERHANMVVNRARATAVDVLRLTRIMAERVADEFGVSLVPEVRFIGQRPELD